jgi:predicted ATP-dependent serine protease
MEIIPHFGVAEQGHPAYTRGRARPMARSLITASHIWRIRMLNTKLILIEGLPGAGKSTTAHPRTTSSARSKRNDY